MARQNVLTGAAVLAVAGLMVKGIGACFKIPLGILLRPEGMASFSVAYNLYAMLFVLATAGAPIAVSKLVSESLASGRRADAKRVFFVARILFSVAGAAGAAALFFCAKPLALAMGAPDAASSIAAIAPAVFFVSLVCVHRGYHQGHGDMVPTAYSEIIEALGKLVLGLSAAWWLGANGASRGAMAAGAVAGVSAGAALAYLYFRFSRRAIASPLHVEDAHVTRYRVLARRLVAQALPITLGAGVISLTNVIDSALIMKLLQGIGYSIDRSMWLYGTYTYATNLFNLPNVLVATLAVSLVPAVAEATARGERTRVEKTTATVLVLTLVLSIVAAAGLFAFAPLILHILYGRGVETDAIEQAVVLLRILCLAVVPLAVVTVTNALHQASGRMRLPVYSMLLGAGVKLASNWVLVANPNIHVLGAAWSTVLCYVVIAASNWILLRRTGFSGLRAGIDHSVWREIGKMLHSKCKKHERT